MSLRNLLSQINPMYLIGEPLCFGCDVPSMQSICAECLSELDVLPVKGCAVCRFPFGEKTKPNSESHEGCRWCNRLRYLPNELVSGFAYRGVAARIFQQVKFYGYWRGLSPLIQQALPHIVSMLVTGSEPILMAVPESFSSRMNRVFHPADAFAKALSKATGAPLKKGIKWKTRGKHQVGLDYSLRRENMKGRFNVNLDVISGVPVRVVLVDDVLTTGATLEAITRVLRKKGVKEVVWVTLFRTL